MISAITFSPLLAQDSGDWPFWLVVGIAKFLTAVFIAGLDAAILIGMVYLLHFLFSLPLRRVERARLFLDLVDASLKRGQPVEEMVLSVARSRDLSMGVRFHMLAAHLEAGLRFGEAIKQVPQFLPPQLTAILLAGEQLGDLKKVLPASREILRERPVAVRSALHYLILVVLCFSPAFIGVSLLTMCFVVPKFKDVAAGLGLTLYPLSRFVFDNSRWLIASEFLFSILMLLVVTLYVGGPGLIRCLQLRSFPVTDWIAWRVPWKRKRLQRTFSAMLAVLLDGGAPEAEAVRIAGDCTANEIGRQRAARIIAALQNGVKLKEAVQVFDDDREFRWRMANAAHTNGGFLGSLRGWHEALDARAFQLEESAAHAVTTGVVILNGAFVALIAIAMFGILVGILKHMAFAP